MTPSELKYHVESRGEDSFFFARKTMKFHGDSMRNYGVRSTVIKSNYDAEGMWTSNEGVDVDVWELYRRQPVKYGVKSSAYFAKSDYRRVFSAKGE